jgi:hypothetical protein
MNLVSPLERQPSSRTDFRPSEECLGLSASLGIRPRVCVPLFRHVLCASTPRRHRCRRSACRCQATDLFRPRGFSPPRRFTPHTGLGFVAPRNRMEFAAFLDFAPVDRPTEADRLAVDGPRPRSAFHTLQRIPLAGSGTASLRPLPSCCSVACRPSRAPKCSTRPSARQQDVADRCLSRCRSSSSALVVIVRALTLIGLFNCRSD